MIFDSPFSGLIAVAAEVLFFLFLVLGLALIIGGFFSKSKPLKVGGVCVLILAAVLFFISCGAWSSFSKWFGMILILNV